MKSLTLVEDVLCALRRTSSIVLLPLLIMSLSILSAGQESAATLSGTVTDQAGAVVVGASLQVHSQETGTDVRTVTTSTSGSFNITNLPAGHYTITVREQGFQTYVAQDVILYTAEKHRMDVQLKAGKISEEVEVTAENAPIQTTTAEQSGTVTGEQVRELALNNRNFEQLILLQPGVVGFMGDEIGFGVSNNTAISVNGARSDANNWIVDGADINDSGSNSTLTNTPSIDAIQEFTLERSNYDASFGRSGGGQVVVSTKSGTTKFHGSAYEFNRNNLYNANSFADRAAIAQGGSPSANATPIERYNDYGFTIGGPIVIPKAFHPARDKTFFFWSEEWRKQEMPGTNTLSVPSAQNLTGVFTTPITDFIPGASANCVTSSGGTWTISKSCWSQNAAAYVNAFMAPQASKIAGNTLNIPYSQLNNFRQDLVKIDQILGEKVHLYARYMGDTVPQGQPFGLWMGNNWPGVANTMLDAPGRNIVVNGTVTITPHIVNEVEYVNAWGAINGKLSNAYDNSSSLYGQLALGNDTYKDPYGRIPNVAFNAQGYVGVNGSYAPYFERNIERNLFDNLSIQKGNHGIRLGATVAWMQKHENGTHGQPTFNFDNGNGNDTFANFLLGQATSYSQVSKDTIPHLHYMNFEAYVQDDWRVTRRLTLNLGVRYSYFPSPSDSDNTLVNFDPLLFNKSNAPSIYPTGLNAGNMEPGPYANAATYANGLILPKGAACASAQAVSTTASCSPYGGGVNPNSNNNFAPRIGLAYDPFGDGKWSLRAGYGIFFDRTLNGMWEWNAFFDPPLVQTSTINNQANNAGNLFDNPTVGVAAGASTTPGPINAVGLPILKIPSYQDFNVSVQHEVLPNTVVEVGYVGTLGTHLIGDIDINQPTLASRLSSPYYDVNALRPYPGYGPIVSRATIFTSNYHSLQASVNRRMTKGLTLGAAYTWSKQLTDNWLSRSSMAPNSYNLKQGYGAPMMNVPQNFTLNYVYDFPFYKDQHGVTGHVLGGWQLSGITNIQSGQSLTVTQSQDPWSLVATNQSTPSCQISAQVPTCPVYPRGIGLDPSTLSGSNSSATIPALQIGNSKGNKSTLEWFNTNAFQQAVGQYSNRKIGSLPGPRLQIWNMSLFKNIKFVERVDLQLRLEAFNVFNHGVPAVNNPFTGASGIDLNYGDSTFGQVLGWHNPRELQIGAKIKF